MRLLKTIVLKNQPCAFFGINHKSLRIYKIFTFVKSSHLRMELHLRMLRRSLRRWCRSSDDELHVRRWCRSSDDELRGRRLGTCLNARAMYTFSALVGVAAAVSRNELR